MAVLSLIGLTEGPWNEPFVWLLTYKYIRISKNITNFMEIDKV